MGARLGLCMRRAAEGSLAALGRDGCPNRLALVRGVSRSRGMPVRRRAARMGFRGVFPCRHVIAGLMVDGGEVMALGGRQVVLGRCQVVLRGWMLNGHIGPPYGAIVGRQGSLAAHRVAVSAPLDRQVKPADLASRWCQSTEQFPAPAMSEFIYAGFRSWISREYLGAGPDRRRRELRKRRERPAPGGGSAAARASRGP